jgi:GT2 family glycosyltransferase
LYEQVDGEFTGLNVSLNYVAGGVQLFRREVFEEIGEFVPLKYGCEDTITEVKTRMFGWEVRTFPEVKVFHHREMGSYEKNIFANLFYAGKRDYLVGYHPLFYIVKVLSRFKDRPIFLSSIVRLSSYFLTPLLGNKRVLPNDFFQYFRYEQILRLKGMLGLPKGKGYVPSLSGKKTKV